MMTLGQRIEARAKALGVSQSELARRVNVGSTTINGLVRGDARWSPHLFKIARALNTSAEYLVGETEDAETSAPASGSAVQFVTMQVAWPEERALARMFEGLLRSMDLTAPVDEQALLLAKRLPIGLSQLRDLLPDAGPADRPATERAADLATSVRGPRQ